MVAPNFQSARIGSGGISFAMTADKSQLRATLDEATADIKRWKADIKDRAKAKIEIDYEETSAVRGFEAFIRKLKRENAKIRIGVELDKVGLGDIYREVNGLKKKATRIEDWRPDETPEMRSRASIQAARAEYQERLDLEHKFSAQLEREEKAKGGGSNGIGGIPFRSLLRGGIYGTAIRAIAQYASGAVDVAGGLSVAGSSDPYLKSKGYASALQGAESVPVIGNVVKAFDDLVGASKSLNMQMQSRILIEHQAVEQAQFGNTFTVAAASAAEQRRALNRDIESTQGLHRGSARVSNALGGGIGLLAGYLGDKFFGDSEKAQRDAITAVEKTNQLRLKYMREDSDTEIGALGLRAQNFGLKLADEDALVGIRGVRAGISRSTDSEGRYRAQLEGMAQLRAMKAGLMVRGGGIVSPTNLATDMIGDPFNLDPTLNARVRANGMVDTAMSQLSQATAPQINVGGLGSFLPGAMNKAVGEANLRLQSISFARAQNNQLQMGQDGVTEKSLDYASQQVNILGQIKELLSRDTFLH